MDAQYPEERFIREVLDEGERHIAGRTKQSFLLSLDKAKRIMVVVRGADGWHAAYDCRPPQRIAHVRGDWADAELPLSQDEITLRWFKHAAGQIAQAVVLGQEAERLGVAPEDMWRNSPGEMVATLDEGVTVRWFDVIDSMSDPTRYSFYEGDQPVLRVSRKLLGEKPDRATLQAIWNAYRDGLSDGILQGTAEGRRALKRDLATLLSEAA